MVAIVLIHMAQVFLFGAYKFPARTHLDRRRLSVVATLGMAFTGQVFALIRTPIGDWASALPFIGRVPFDRRLAC